MFRDTISEMYRDILNMMYFDKNFEVNEKNVLKNISGDQLLLSIECNSNKMEIYGQVDIDDSEGMISLIQMDLFKEDVHIAQENIVFRNGEAEYHSEQACYMPVREEEYNVDGIETIKSLIEKFVIEQRQME